MIKLNNSNVHPKHQHVLKAVIDIVIQRIQVAPSSKCPLPRRKKPPFNTMQYNTTAQMPAMVSNITIELRQIPCDLVSEKENIMFHKC